MGDTQIEWTDKTWNPVTGCTPISEGCANCYAKRMANRLRGRCGYPEDEPFRVTLHEDKLEEPSTWKKTCRVLVRGRMNSILIEFADGLKVVTSRLAARRLPGK